MEYMNFEQCVRVIVEFDALFAFIYVELLTLSDFFPCLWFSSCSNALLLSLVILSYLFIY